MYLPLQGMLVLPMDFKVFQHRESAPRNAYKHAAFFMNSCAFLQNWLQDHQYCTGFIRFWEVVSPKSQNVVFLMVFVAFWHALWTRGSSHVGPLSGESLISKGGGYLAHGHLPPFWVISWKSLIFKGGGVYWGGDFYLELG